MSCPPSSGGREDDSALAHLVRDAEVEHLLPDRAPRDAFLQSDSAKPKIAAWEDLRATIDALRGAVVAADDSVEGTRAHALLAALHELAEHTSAGLHNDLEETESKARALVRDFRDCCGLWSVSNTIRRETVEREAAISPTLSTPPASPSRSAGTKRAGSPLEPDLPGSLAATSKRNAPTAPGRKPTPLSLSPVLRELKQLIALDEAMLKQIADEGAKFLRKKAQILEKHREESNASIRRGCALLDKLDQARAEMRGQTRERTDMLTSLASDAGERKRRRVG